MADEQKQTSVKVDGVDYAIKDMSNEAKTQVANLQYVEREMATMKANLAVFMAAKQRYIEELKKHLPG